MRPVTVYSMGGATSCPGVRVISVVGLSNPYTNRTLRPLDGRHPAVQAWVLAHGGKAVLDAAEREVRAGKLEAIGFRCLGGHHRSAALAELLGRRLGAEAPPHLELVCRVIHLDLP